MKKEIKPTRTIIPVDQAIAQVQEAIDVYEEKLGQLYAEMKILRDE
jgi:rubrerythrin